MNTTSILLAMAEAQEAAAKTLRRHAALQVNGSPPTPSPDTQFGSAVEVVRSMHPQVGSRQEEVIALLEEAGRDGLNTGEMSRAMEYDQPNVYLTLQSLMRHGFVERDTSVSPHIYRLTDDLLAGRDEDSI